MSKFFYNIADKNAYFLINRKILVTRDTKTNASIGWLQTRHNHLVWMKCISQFQLRPAPPRATAGHLPALSVPRVGHLQILCCPGAGHLPTPGPFLSFWHARGFLSENNYTEDFTGKESRLAHLSRTGKIEEVCKGMFLILCMHFFIAYRARIT